MMVIEECIVNSQIRLYNEIFLRPLAVYRHTLPHTSKTTTQDRYNGCDRQIHYCIRTYMTIHLSHTRHTLVPSQQERYYIIINIRKRV
jgi:hypothetical protein